MAWLSSQPEAFQIRHSDEVGQAVQNGAESDPQTAAMLIAKLPSASNRKYSFGNVISTWSGRAPEECKAWLDQQTDAELKSAGLAAYAGNLAQNDPGAAMQILLTLPNLS